MITELIYTKTYLCRYNPVDLKPIRALTYVQTVGIYPLEVKSTITLKSILKSDTQQTKQEVYVYFHEDLVKSPAQITTEISGKVGVPEGDIQPLEGGVFLPVDKSKVESISAVDSVKRIEERREPVLANNLARGVCYSSAYNPANDAVPFMKYQGAGQTVCVADTGIDKTHPAFKNTKIDILMEQGKVCEPLCLLRNSIYSSHSHILERAQFDHSS